MVDFIAVGKKIQSLRIESHISQEELANRLYVTRQALSRWENGISVPTIDTLLELSKIFKVDFMEILCMNDNTVYDYDESDIFLGRDRNIVIKRIFNQEFKVNLPDVFYQFSPSERMIVLKAIKDGKYKCDFDELVVKLTISEKKFLGGKL